MCDGEKMREEKMEVERRERDRQREKWRENERDFSSMSKQNGRSCLILPSCIMEALPK